MGNALAPTVMKILKNSPQFNANHGIDHFMVHSTSMLAQAIGQKLKFLYNLMHNSTIISFEYLPLILWAQGRPYQQAMPFPSVYHHTVNTTGTTDMNDVVYLKSVPALKENWSKNHTRAHFVSFFGSQHTNMPPSNKLRKSLEEQCTIINTKTHCY